MVMTKSGYDVNRITITNNTAKYYSDTAKEFAVQAKEFATDVVQTKSDIDNILASSDFVSVSQNIQKIVTVADNIENLGNTKLEWGFITGNIDSQTDLDAKLDIKANVSDVYTKSEIDTKLDGIEALLVEI